MRSPKRACSLNRSSESLVIRNNLITANGNYGVRLSFSSNNLKRSVLYNTIAYNSGAIYLGIYSSGYSNPAQLVGNIVVGNGTCGIYDQSVNPTTAYNDSWGQSTDYYGLTPTATDISKNPLFADVQSGNFHLLAGSPCINAADPLQLDLDGSRSDMGMYGGMGLRIAMDPSDTVPNRPSNLQPVDASTDVALNATLRGSAFSDPDSSDLHTASHWRVRRFDGT